jgi:transposase
LGRSRGGLSTKIHMLADAVGRPMRFVITGGQVNDCTQAERLLENVETEYVIGDKGYDAERVLQKIGEWTCAGSVDCFRLRTVRGKGNVATNEPGLPTGVSPRSHPAG